MEEAERREVGARPEDARPAARAMFGNVALHREDARAAWSFPSIESVWQDIRYAVRVLAKQPGFTVVAVLTLALGIGANTAIFSLIDTVMLRMLPVQRPQELLQVTMSTPNFGNGSRASFTNPLWEELRDHQDIFSGVFAWGTDNFNLAQSGLVENVRGLYISGGYFTTLGVRPAAGRLFTVNDDKRGCAGVAVLSYGFWQEHFGSAATTVGGTIPISGHPFEIVGVSAPGFFGTNVGSSFDVAVPICAEAILAGKDSSLDRARWWLRVIGRPKRGISPEQAGARLAVLSPPTFAATVPANWKPAQQQSYKTWKFLTVPGATGISSLRSQYDLPLKMLMAIAGLVLLIACANVASLMLARASSRGKEIAVRLALGASRLRLVRQLLTESVLLSVSGGLLGILFARWGSRLLLRQISTGQENVFLDLALDGRVLWFTAGIAVLTGLLFGILPALRSTRVSLSGSMKGSAAENGARDARFRSGRWTVAAQVAISLVLVVTAGLFVRSFRNLVTLDAGFDRSNVLVVDIDLHNSNVPDGALHTVSDEMLRRVRAVPGVISVSQAVVAPIGSRTEDDQIIVDDSNAPTGEDAEADINYVSPGYFATLRAPLLEGRDFNERDTGPIPRVLIVNQAFAKKFFPGTDALGKTVRRFATQTTLSEPIEVVGVVRDMKYESLREDFPPIAYFSYAEMPSEAVLSYVLVRTGVRPSALAPAVQQAISEVNKSIALQFRTLAEQVNDSIVPERLLATLSGFFGALALLLAMIGLYGVLAYLVLRRQREIGIRLALGAQRSAILRMIMGDVGRLFLVGAAVGVGITWATTRFAQSLLFGLQAHDVKTIALGIGLLAVVACVASYLPARRAMRVDPAVTLRCE
jgi:predicted permease